MQNNPQLFYYQWFSDGIRHALFIPATHLKGQGTMQSAHAADHGLVWFYACLGKSVGMDCPFPDLKTADPKQLHPWMDKVDTRVTPTELRRFLQDDEGRA